MNEEELNNWALEIGINASTKAHENGWLTLSEMEKAFCIITDIEREVYNGGFDQYFYNSSGDFSIYAYEYLSKLGIDKTATIVKKAISIFPKATPATDREERWMQMEKIESLSEVEWEKCDDDFYELSENRYKKMYEYYQANI